MKKIIKHILSAAFIIFAMFFAIRFYLRHNHESRILKGIISRLETDSRIAEALVTGVNYDDKAQGSFWV